MKKTIFLPIITAILWEPRLNAVPSSGRSVYLNGVDISGAQNQHLDNVNLTIDEKGDLFISAPQYRVFEEDHFLPLSNKENLSESIEHKQLQQLNKPNNLNTTQGMTKESLPSNVNDVKKPASPEGLALPKKP